MSLELRLMTVRVGLVTTFGVLPEVDWNVRWLCWRRMGGDGVGEQVWYARWAWPAILWS